MWIFNFGLETLQLTLGEINKLYAFQMKCVRRILRIPRIFVDRSQTTIDELSRKRWRRDEVHIYDYMLYMWINMICQDCPKLGRVWTDAQSRSHILLRQLRCWRADIWRRTPRNWSWKLSEAVIPRLKSRGILEQQWWAIAWDVRGDVWGVDVDASMMNRDDLLGGA